MEEITYEAIVPETILDELKEQVSDDFVNTTVNFIQVNTQERLNNILEVFKDGKYKIQIWKRSVDRDTYEPMLYCIATKQNQILSEGIKFITYLSLTSSNMLSTFEDYYTDASNVESVIQVLKDLPASPQIKSDIRYIGSLGAPQIEAENV